MYVGGRWVSVWGRKESECMWREGGELICKHV